MLLANKIKENAERVPHKNAIVTYNQVLTYGDLWEDICKCKEHLKTLDLNNNDVVGLIYSNHVDFIVILYALQLLGIPSILLGNRLKPQELDKLIQMSEISVLLVDSTQTHLLNHIDPEQSYKFGSSGEFVRLNSSIEKGKHFTYKPDDFIGQITSGSNGFPKIAIRTGLAVHKEVEQTIQQIGMTPDDVVMTIPPIYHSFGLVVGTLAPLYLGAVLVLVDDFISADVLDLMQRQSPTILIAVPYMYYVLNQTARHRYNLTQTLQSGGKLRLCLSAGAPLSQDTYEEFAKLFGVQISQDYGSTETGVICIGQSSKYEKGWVGYPVGTTEVGIFDKDGNRLGVGMTGCIRVKSEWFARAYAAPVELNDTAYVNGWFLTNDIGKINEDGSVVVLGRLNDMLMVAGNKVDPDEVENVIRSYGDISEAAIICKRDDHVGDIIVAFIVSDQLVDTDKLLKYCRACLADYKIPRKIIQIEALPRSRTGKILKKNLLQMLDNN